MVFYWYFNVHYSSEQTKCRSNEFFWKKWYALTIWSAQVVRDSKRLGIPELNSQNLFKTAQLANVHNQKTKTHWRFGQSTTGLHQGAKQHSAILIAFQKRNAVKQSQQCNQDSMPEVHRCLQVKGDHKAVCGRNRSTRKRWIATVSCYTDC